MSVGNRLALSFLGVTVLLAVPAVYALDRLNELGAQAARTEARQGEALDAAGRLRGTLAEVDRLVRSHVAAPDSAIRRALEATLREAGAQADRLGEAGFPGAEAGVRASLGGLEGEIRRVVGLVEAGSLEAATERLAEVRPLLEGARDSLLAATRAVELAGAEAAARARQVSARARTNVGLGLAGSLLLVLGVSVWVTRALGRPLRRLEEATAAVARGRLDPPGDLPYDRRDEIGALCRSFRSMEERLGELDRMRAEFVSFASHRLKTPIHVISGHVQLLEEELYAEFTARQRRGLDAIQEQIGSLVEQVEVLSRLGEIERRAPRIVVEDVLTEDLLLLLRQEFEPLARGRAIDFVMEREPDTPRRIRADERRIREEVLGNLLSNALKFTAAGGSVRVRARKAEGGVEFEVADDGMGIPPEDLPHVFEKYYRGATGARSMGSGLGLAIAREIVQAHGGSIEVESERGVGTSFRVWLPEKGPQYGVQRTTTPQLDPWVEKNSAGTSAGPR